MVPKQALIHLSKDPIMHALIKNYEPKPLPLKTDVYYELLESIVSQQLSTKAAATIFSRFLSLFNDGYPHASQLICIENETLRSIGFSYQKANYAKNVAHFALRENLSFEHLNALSDTEIVDYLCSIKGVGKWTAEMVLIFTLQKPDVFPIDDLAVRQAAIALYGVESSGKALYSQLQKIAEQWSPYRSYASLYLWKWYGTNKAR
jgi:DNA-3-methyladenine glycosylase II